MKSRIFFVFFILQVFVVKIIYAQHYIGGALSVLWTNKNIDGSYNVRFNGIVENFSDDTAKNVCVYVNLNNMYKEPLVARVESTAYGSINGNYIAFNENFGINDSLILMRETIVVPNSSISFAYELRVELKTKEEQHVCLNNWFRVNASYLDDTIDAWDISTNGLNAELNGNNNPTDSMETTPVSVCFDSSELIIPNIITPNADDINDVFVIAGITNYVEKDLTIYNRWGKIVYHTLNYENDWKGTFNPYADEFMEESELLAPSTYFYVLRLKDDTNDMTVRNGCLTIMY